MKTNRRNSSPLPWIQEDWFIYAEKKDGTLVRVADFTPADSDRISNRQVDANIALVMRAVHSNEKLLEACKDLTAAIDLSKLNIRKDFSLINAHACALRAIHDYEALTRNQGGVSAAV